LRDMWIGVSKWVPACIEDTMSPIESAKPGATDSNNFLVCS